ncbi:MAG TPA: helix-turn-helix transcriptional regulator [Clostridia bacterium]|nr:helix-turn-helix transcriptional regulator [Clostridia bacterium]
MVTALRLRRVRTGKTLRQFAREIGINEGTLIRIERGQCYVPKKWREPLAQALGVDPEEVLDPQTGWPRLVA